MKSLEYTFIGTCAALSLVLLVVALFNLSFGLVYDTHAFADTFFILGAAWRVLQGFEPVLDFGHFYGGFISETLSWTMSLFGENAQVLYTYSLVMSVFLVGCVAIVVRQEISAAGFSAIVLLILTLMLTRSPLEMNSSVIRVVSQHAFLYNRYAQAAMFVVALVVALKTNNRQKEVIGGVVAGLLVGSVCLTKSTFVVAMPGLVLALLIGRRWFATGGVVAGLLAFALMFDPGLARFFGSLDYALAHVGNGNGVPGLIRKTVQIPLFQPIALGLAAVALGLCIKGRGTWWEALSIATFAGSVFAMTATMGGNGSIGQLALPTLAGVAIGCAELARRRGAANAVTVQCLAGVLVLGFAVPHVLNSAAASAEGYLRKSEVLIDEGPYSRYLNLPEDHDKSPVAAQYEMLADGMRALRNLGDPSLWGIVANGGITFEHALRAKPVAGYPLWQRETAPELAENRPLSEEVDLVLMSRTEGVNVLDHALRSKITDDFVLCTVTDHWEIYVHQRLNLETCSVN